MKEIHEILKHPVVHEIKRVLGADADLHLVGGAVRDLILGEIPKDLDFATKLKPQEMIERFEKADIRFIETGIRRGTITALLEGEPVEITTFRNYEDENTFTETIEEDLAARDFTINAIALNVHNGKLVDPFNGEDHLTTRMVVVLQAVGDARKRFEEDPHRILRLARFAGKFHAVIHPDTFSAAVELGHLVDNVAVERIQAELVKILTMEKGANVKATFHFLEGFGVLERIIPEFKDCVGCEQNRFHSFDVFNHILHVIKGTPNDLVVRLAALLHDIAKPHTITVGEDGVRHFLTHEDVGAEMTKEILTRLKFPLDVNRDVCHLIKNHMRSTDMGPKGIRRLIRELGPLLDKWLLLKKADKMGGRPDEIIKIFEKKWETFTVKLDHELNRKETHPFEELKINGHDILEAGVKKGPEVGRVLNALMEIVLDNPEENNRETLLKHIEGLV